MTNSIPQALEAVPPAPRRAPEPVDIGLRELIAVREIVHAFLTADRPAEVFQFALNRVSPLVGATISCVYVMDGTSPELMRLAAVYNWPGKYGSFLNEMRVRLGFGPSGEAASERRVIEVADVFADSSLEDWQEVAAELGFRGIVALPLQTAQGVLGTVTFYFARPGPFASDTRHLLRVVADQMAATAEKARLIDDLRRANAHLGETNAKLERQNAALLEARRVKDEFLANMSHELRTPLTAVMGYIALMQEGLAGPMTPEQQHTLTQVRGASEQLLGLISDLLELTAIRRGGPDVALDEFDPREALREALALTPGRPQDVEVCVVVPENAPLMRSDRAKVVKVLASLLSNAYKFTPRGEVRALVSADGDRVAYSVEDTGIGIPAAAHEYVFDEFRQVDGSTTRVYGGSGLGLALARGLARRLGGEITLTSEPGSGSTFTVELPLRAEAAEAVSGVALARESHDGGA
ncbi:MAG: GAF domain-containing sensor histidine kinase [Gemmatimonadota bacterium]|nr:GAF domain-containing sensor histidine kinase [Gemmatimonadota bacterium]